MERFPEEEIVVPEGLANNSEHVYHLKRFKQDNRRNVARKAASAGKPLEYVQAMALSPTEGGVLMHFAAAAKKNMEDTGEIGTVNLSTWSAGAEDAYSWFYNLWVNDMAVYDAEKGWALTPYALEVEGALLQQFEEDRFGRPATS